MSQQLPSNKNTSEEVDLIVFFNLIGNALNRVLEFFKSIFLGLYTLFISIAKAFFKNIKVISIIVLTALIIGFVLDTYKSKTYYSEMYVKPYFDSKYELVNSLEYYNSLIKLKDYDEFSKQLGLNIEEAESIIEFEIEVGLETKNDQIEEFNKHLETYDSLRATKADFKDFIDNRNIYNAEAYLIRARSKKYNIFKKLEKSIDAALENDFSSTIKKERDSVLSLDVEKLELSLIEVKLMKENYLSILDIESKKTSVSSSLDNAFGLKVDKSDTKEDVFLERELKILDELNVIKKELVTKSRIYDKISSFKEKGLIENIWYKKFKIMLPLLTLFLLCFSFGIIKFYNHAINYKS